MTGLRHDYVTGTRFLVSESLNVIKCNILDYVCCTESSVPLWNEDSFDYCVFGAVIHNSSFCYMDNDAALGGLRPETKIKGFNTDRLEIWTSLIRITDTIHNLSTD